MFELELSAKKEPPPPTTTSTGRQPMPLEPPLRRLEENVVIVPPVLLSSNNANAQFDEEEEEEDDDDDWREDGSMNDDSEPLFLHSMPIIPMLPPPPPTTSTTNTIQRKLCLLTPLLLCLYMLTDSNYYKYNNNSSLDLAIDSPHQQQQQQQQRRHHHLAFVTALSRHPPSLRVFRMVSTGAFLLACTAGALYFWEWAERSSNSMTSITTTTPSSTVSKNATTSSSGREDNDIDEESGRRRRRREMAVEESSYEVERITSRAVGKLLFAPPSLPTTNALWGSRLLRLVPKRRNINNSKKKKKKGNRRSSRNNGFGGADDRRCGNGGSSGSIGSSGGSITDGSSHSLKRRKNSPTTSSSGHRNVSKKAVAAATTIVGGDAITPSAIAAAAAAAAAIQSSDNSNDNNDMLMAQHYHPQLDTIMTTTTTHNTIPSCSPPQPPSPTSVLGASLDVITITCIFLIFFTISSAEGGRYIDQASNHVVGQQYMKFVANVAAPLFPLSLFGLSLLAICLPWTKRRVLWNILSYTYCAPFYPVTFRDGFLGDILTSIVRPLQDLAFTILFVPLGLKAWWSSDMYTMDAAAIPLERSWLLHTVVLPACTLSPLWWRFMQNLRQCYDAKQRWPYLGNALKYLLAAEVSTFGLFNPSVKRSPVWMMCFFVTTLYQVWWDVFMDWGLLERESNLGYYYATVDRRQWLWWWPYTLRTKRLYKRTWMYHVIFIINFCLRFVGMITLIPPVYLSRTTGLIVSAYKDPDFQLFVGLFVAVAEIFRRTIWALLRLEWEVIKTSPERRTMETASRPSSINMFDVEELKPMEIATSERVWSFRTKRDINFTSLSDMSNLNDIQVLSELCVWATVFSGIAIIAAAHREVL